MTLLTAGLSSLWIFYCLEVGCIGKAPQPFICICMYILQCNTDPSIHLYHFTDVPSLSGWDSCAANCHASC